MTATTDERPRHARLTRPAGPNESPNWSSPNPWTGAGRAPADPTASSPTSTCVRALVWILGTILAACVAGIFLATPDGSGFVQPGDNVVARMARITGPAMLVTVVDAIAFLDTVGGAALVALAAIAVVGRRRARHHLVGPLSCAAAAAVAVTFVAQQVVARPEPRAATTALSAATTSFPGAGVAVAIALTAASRAIRARRGSQLQSPVTALAGAMILATAGLMSGVHWLSDELAGAAIGAFVGLIVGRAAVCGGRRRRPRRLAPRTIARAGLAVALITIPPTAASYWGALHAPGYAATDARTVDWLRTHGLSSLVDRAESWWLWTHLPSTTHRITAMPNAPVRASGNQTGAPSAASPDLPGVVVSLIVPALPNEGRWSLGQVDAHGATQIATTSIRPDPLHPALVASLAWMNAATVRFALVAGTRQPAGHAGSWNATVPDALRSTLLAAFNSGYKINDTPGGAIVEGMHARQLRAGLATFVVRADGSATVGEWGRDVSSTTDLVAARQNLHLIVVRGQLVAGLRTNVGQLWGRVQNALPTWRSGIGVDRSGNLLYASGNQLTIDTLAGVLQRAGAVTAMELDIHKHMVTYNLFTHARGTAKLVGHKLSPDMTEPATRYLQPDQRDFVAVFSR